MPIAAAASGRFSSHRRPGCNTYGGDRSPVTVSLPIVPRKKCHPAGHCSTPAAGAATAAAVYDTWFDTWEEYSDDDDDDIVQHVQSVSMHTNSHISHHHQQQICDDPVLSHLELFHERSEQQQQQSAVQFSLLQQVEYGQFFRVVGSAPCLGSWEPSKGPDMSWHKGHVWSVDVVLPAGKHEFKYVLVHRSGHLQWEPGNNRVLNVPAAAAQLEVQGPWAATDNTKVHIKQQRQSKLQPDTSRQKSEQHRVSMQTHSGAAAAKPHILHQQQQQQPLLQKAAATAPAPGKVPLYQHTAVSGAEQLPVPRQRTVSRPPASWQRPKEAAVPAAAAAAVPSSTLVLTDSQQQLVQQLTLQQQELSKSMASMKAEVLDMETELAFIQEELAHITAERILQQQQQQQHEEWTPAGAVSSALAAAAPAGLGGLGVDDDSIWSGLAAQALANTGRKSAPLQQQQQLELDAVHKDSMPPGLLHSATQNKQPSAQHMRKTMGGISPSNGSSSSSSSSSIDGNDEFALDPEDEALLKQLDIIAGRTNNSSYSKVNGSSTAADALLAPDLSNTAAAAAPGVSDWPLQGIPADGVDCAVLSWRQGLLSLRHDALLLQADMTAVDNGISSVQQQLAANTAAVVQPAGKVQGPKGVRSSKHSNISKSGKASFAAGQNSRTAAEMSKVVETGVNFNSAAATNLMPQGLDSSGKSLDPRAPVAGNVVEYQRLLLKRFNELTDHIAANLESSVEYLRADDDSKQQQRLQVGSAAFAAAHYAAAAAYAASDASETDADIDTAW